jgi:hypothetical protein
VAVIGCEFCQDPRERSTEMRQLGDKPGTSDLLLRCPRCGTLWDCAAFGREDIPLSVDEARRRFPDADLSDL